MDFRSRLLGTLRAVEPLFRVPGLMVVGSEVPNLLEPDAAATLVVSQDVDLGVFVTQHAAVKAALGDLFDLQPSADEPSVWVPKGGGTLSLLGPAGGMPDPRPDRERVAALLRRLEESEGFKS